MMDMEQARVDARGTFKHFWYQVALDFNRIVPAVALGIVKAAFREDDFEEYMWCGDIFYDGQFIEATLLNEPNELRGLEEGQRVRFSIEDVWDWLCVLDEQVYGGYTIMVLRSQMTAEERSEHDMAWGVPFDAAHPEPPAPSTEFENVLVPKMLEAIASRGDLLSEKDEDGRTLLHNEVLYGRRETTRALLEAGADPMNTCKRGWTPADYATAVGWTDLVALLQSQG